MQGVTERRDGEHPREWERRRWRGWAGRPKQSPARQAGSSDHTPALDFYGKAFLTPRSIGAVEFEDPH